MKGLCARGGFEVDVSWKNGKLVEATVRSANGGSTQLRYGNVTREVKLAKGKTFSLERTVTRLEHAANVIKSQNITFRRGGPFPGLLAAILLSLVCLRANLLAADGHWVATWGCAPQLTEP